MKTRHEEVVEAWKSRLEIVKKKANLAHDKMYETMNRPSFEYWAERYSNNIRIFNQMLNHRPQGA